MSNFKIFIVEDDLSFGELLKYHLSLNPEYDVHLYTTAQACIEHLRMGPQVISTDLSLPDMPGSELLKKIKCWNSDIPVIMFSSQEDTTVALNLLKEGAYQYMVKDANTREILCNSIQRIRENTLLKKEVEELKEQLESKYNFEKTMIGQSPEMKKSFTLAEKAVKSNITVFITGETGTGKKVIAKAIHYNSERKRKPFAAINMANIPKELIESELFGHEKGAFTGAIGRKTGKFEEADGGTLFLNEITELDLNLQSKLLRVLQEGEVVRAGSSERIKFNTRLLISTHKNLAEEVKKGNFREDLYYKIMGLPIELPPLRQRGNDILILAKHFAEQCANENNFKVPNISVEAHEKLLQYNFPGNLRELKAIMNLACIMCDGQDIKAKDITFNTIKDEGSYTSVEKSLREYTAEIITFYLNKYDHNVVEVARKLEIGKSTIYNMLNAGELKRA
jgi:two-component system, NtrC family, response regulator AtoC